MQLVTFDDLKRMFEEETARVEEVQRTSAEENNRREARIEHEELRRAEEKAKQERINEERSRIEKENWGTPQKAYETWESRTKELVAMAEDYGRLMRTQAEEARIRYSHVTANLVNYRIHVSLLFDRAKLRKDRVERVVASEFSYRIDEMFGELHKHIETWGQPESFLLTRNGEVIQFQYRDPEVSLKSAYDGRVLLYDRFTTWGDTSKLEHAIKKILVPTIIADRIEARMSGIHFVERKFHEFGGRLREGSLKYEYLCSYDSPTSLKGSEDSVTVLFLWLSEKHGTNVRVYNPSNLGVVTKSLSDLYLRIRHDPAGGRSNVGGPLT